MIQKLIEQIQMLPSLKMTFLDIIQILILSFLIYRLFKGLYKTREWLLVKGLLVIGVVYMVVVFTNMTAIQILMQTLFGTLMIAIVIMLQPKLQKIVEIIGQRDFKDLKSLFQKKKEKESWFDEHTINAIVTACEIMGQAKTGALICMERRIPLKDYSKSGIQINGEVSNQLLINIFEKNTPLHDGAVIIKNNTVESATCYLPMSNNRNISKSLGTRHRAAAGLTEKTDAIVIVVSEETGAISFCKDGNIKHNVQPKKLTYMLKEHMYKSDNIVSINKGHQKGPVWLKCAAPIISFLIWLVIMFAADPIIDRTIKNVPVEIVNANALDVAGQSYTIQSGKSIDVKMHGKRSELDEITLRDLDVKADFNEMSMTYAVPIRVEFANKNTTAQIINTNDVMMLQLEDLVQTEVPIDIMFTNDVNPDVVLAPKQLKEETLLVTCPKSMSKTLDKAVLVVDAMNRKNDFVVSAEPRVFDKNGTDITKKTKLSKEAIDVSVQIYETKEVPLRIELVEQNKDAEYYFELDDAQLDVDHVRIAGPDDKLKTTEEIVIRLDPDVKSVETKEISINLENHLPADIKLAKKQPEKVSVKLALTKYQKKMLPLMPNDIKAKGLDPNKYQTTIANGAMVISFYYDISKFEEKDLSVNILGPSVKLQDGMLGKVQLPVTFNDVEGIIMRSQLQAECEIHEIQQN